MTTGCGKFDDAILDLVYGELDDTEAEALRIHAADCPACAEAVAELSALRRLSAHAVSVEPPQALDASILAAARASTAGESAPAETPVVRPVQEDKPSFFELLRAWLLHPAFAGAAVIGLVLVVTFFVSQKGGQPPRSESTVQSVMEERPVEIVGAAPSEDAKTVQKAETPAPREEADRAAEPAEPAESRATSMGEAPAPPTARRKATSATTEKSPAENKENRSSSKPKSRAVSSPRRAASSAPGSGGLSDHISTPTEGAGYNAAKGAPAAEPAPRERVQAPSAADDLLEFAPPPSKKKADSAYADEDRAAESEAVKSAPSSAPSMSRGPSPMSPTADEDAYSRGMAAYQRGDCSAAIADLSAVIASPSKYPGRAAAALHHIARCEKRSGSCARAMRHYDELIDRHPSYSGRAEALYEAAQCCKRLGRNDRARTLLETLRTLPGWSTRADEALDRL